MNSPLKGPLKGGRRTDEERAMGAKCAGEIDPISFDEIDPRYAIRLTEDGFTRCYDIRLLERWLRTGKKTNPSTNKNFSQQSLEKIHKKIQKLGGSPPKCEGQRNQSKQLIPEEFAIRLTEDGTTRCYDIRELEIHGFPRTINRFTNKKFSKTSLDKIQRKILKLSSYFFGSPNDPTPCESISDLCSKKEIYGSSWFSKPGHENRKEGRKYLCEYCPKFKYPDILSNPKDALYIKKTFKKLNLSKEDANAQIDLLNAKIKENQLNIVRNDFIKKILDLIDYHRSDPQHKNKYIPVKDYFNKVQTKLYEARDAVFVETFPDSYLERHINTREY